MSFPDTPASYGTAQTQFGDPSTGPIPTPTRAPRRGRAVAAVLLALVLMAGAGLGVWFSTRSRGATATAIPSAATSAATAGTATSAAAGTLLTDPVAQKVCPQILELNKTADFSNPDTVEALGELARTSADLSLAHQGGILAARARIARAAKGKNNELQIALDMANAGSDVAQLCMRGGYR